jgi:hypothetical protein
MEHLISRLYLKITLNFLAAQLDPENCDVYLRHIGQMRDIFDVWLALVDELSRWGSLSRRTETSLSPVQRNSTES